MYAALDLSTSSLSSSLVNVNSHRPKSSGFEVMLPTVLKHYEAKKEEKKEENENVVWFLFLLRKHRDRYLNIVGNEIILLSKQHPLHYVIFTLKRWARLIGWLNDIDVALKRINLSRRNVPFRRLLGDDYYVRVYSYTQHVNFHRFYVPHGYKPSQIRPTTNGAVILIEEWNDLLQNVIPTLHKRYPEFTFGV